MNRAGRPLRLVRLGRDFVRFLEPELKAAHGHVIAACRCVPRVEVRRYLRLADVLVQPGRADAFNDYRFPSKLTEFLASGRPVVLPPANIGRFLEDGEECVLLHRGDALEIAEVIERLLDDDALRARLGRGARAFAERSFSWPASAEKLRRFYERALGASRRALPQRLEETERIVDRYGARVPPRLSYATVRDYCDSADRLPRLAFANRDMKDVQRPWTLKAVVGTLRPGARLLEIGAGEPVVAELLARLGYDVTVIDPYDGRDRGPDDVETMKAAYPRLRFVQGLFPGDVPAGERYDGIYSISVLEHVPAGAIDELCARDRPAGRARRLHDPRRRPRAARTRRLRSLPAAGTDRRGPRHPHGRARRPAREARRRPRDLLPLRREPQPLAGRRALRRVPDAPLRLDPALRAGVAMEEHDGLDVGIVSYRSARLLGQCLRSLRDHPPARPLSVIVVDNGPPDGTAAAVLAFPGVELIEPGRNLGFAAATNVALARSRSRYFLALNPDTRVHAGTLDTLLELMDAHPSIAICGCRLELEDGTFDHAAKRSFPTPLGALAHFTRIGRSEHAPARSRSTVPPRSSAAGSTRSTARSC